ncbi:uncharacterized protein LOC133182154 [Saccostrea echinata]|uniref:uncharacterized protein LOC133182154 n=1 Tax=Saccostrea echinata TaxID=191078 RepID=UPI002A803691|nr:uncharacterized protein LOC133182154 [Saccostrea echinata]
MKTKHLSSPLTLQWTIYLSILWIMMRVPSCVASLCPKCLHMESNSFYASIVKLPSNPKCETEQWAELNMSCPNESAEDKIHMCGFMRGNLTVKINFNLLSPEVKGSVTYYDCVLVSKDITTGCQANVTGPMEKALLQKLGPSIPDVTVSAFHGNSCLSYPVTNIRVSPTDGSVEATEPDRGQNPASKDLSSASSKLCSTFKIFPYFIPVIYIHKLLIF